MTESVAELAGKSLTFEAEGEFLFRKLELLSKNTHSGEPPRAGRKIPSTSLFN